MRSDYLVRRDVLDRIEELQDEIERAFEQAEEEVHQGWVDAWQEACDDHATGDGPDPGTLEDYLEDRDRAADVARTYQEARDQVELLLAPEIDELRLLKDFDEELLGYFSDWAHGGNLIPEDRFEDYARQLAKDLEHHGAFDNWPHNCIDWEQAADQLKTDYGQSELDGETYLYFSC